MTMSVCHRVSLMLTFVLHSCCLWEILQAGYALNGDRIKTSMELSQLAEEGVLGRVPRNMTVLQRKALLQLEKLALVDPDSGRNSHSLGSVSDRLSNWGQNVCRYYSPIFLLVVVKSRYFRFSQRLAARNTWAGNKRFGSLKIVTVFFLGTGDNLTFQKSVGVESTIHRDIIQVEEADTDANSARITSRIFQWVTEECSEASFVLVTRDDVVVDFRKLIPRLRQEVDSPHLDETFTICELLPCCSNDTDVPMISMQSSQTHSLHVQGKDQVTVTELCAKDAYVASSQVVAKLHNSSGDTPPFVPEEIWISTLCKKSQIKLPDRSEMFGGRIKPELIIEQYTSAAYLSSALVFGVVGGQHDNREAVIIKQIWSLIEGHYNKSANKQNNFSVNIIHIKRSESQEVFYFTVYFMFVDMLVVICIFAMMLVKKRRHYKLLLHHHVPDGYFL